MNNNILNEIKNNLKTQLSLSDYNKIKDKTIHLGIFKEPYLSLMINGFKTIESRFSQKCLIPFKHISKKDIVMIKSSSGPVIGYFTIKDIKFFSLKETNINDIKLKYNKYLCLKEEFWQDKKNSNYATLIFVDKIYLLNPFKISKKGMQSWIILGTISN